MNIFVLIISLCISSSFYIYESITGTKLGFILLLLLLIKVYSIKKRIIFEINPVDLYFSLFLIYSYLSIFWAKDKEVSLGIFISLLSCYCLFMVVRVIQYNSPSINQLFISSLIFACFVSCIFGFIQFTAGDYYVPGTDYRSIFVGDVYRANGLFDDPNYFGLVLVSVWPLIFYSYPKNIILRNILIIVFIVSIFLTYSRASILIFIFQIFLLAFAKTRNIYSNFFKIGIFIFILGVVFKYSESDLSSRVLSSMLFLIDNTAEVDYSTLERFDLMVAGVDMFFDNFWTGVGFGNFHLFSFDYMSFYPREEYAHNTYLTVAGETGFFGLFFYLVFLILIIARVLRFKNSYLLISLIGLLLSNFFLVAHYFPIAFFYIAVLMGATESYSRRG